MRSYYAASAVVLAAVIVCLLPEKSTSTKSLKELVDAKTFLSKEVSGTVYVSSRQRDPMKAKVQDAVYYKGEVVRFWLESLAPYSREMIVDVEQSVEKGKLKYAVIHSESNTGRHSGYSFDAEYSLLQLVKSCVDEDAAKCPKLESL